MLVSVGEYFSAKFFIAQVANKMYLRKKKRNKPIDIVLNEGGKPDQNEKPNLESRFEGIKNSTIVLLAHPLIQSPCCAFSPFNRSKRSKKQIAAIENVEQKFISELEISRLLDRLRNSDDFIRSLLIKDHRELLRFTRGRIIKDSDSESDFDSDLADSSDEHRFKHNFAIQLAKHSNVGKQTTLDYLRHLRHSKTNTKQKQSAVSPPNQNLVETSSLRMGSDKPNASSSQPINPYLNSVATHQSHLQSYPKQKLQGHKQE